jgi:VWFA-related protein
LVPRDGFFAQAKRPSQSERNPSNEFTFRVPVDVVVVNATAVDAQGKSVPDLRKEDFRIFEDGRPQPIHTFSVESYTSRRQQLRASDRQNQPVTEVTQTEAGDTRFISIVFDDVVTPSFGDLSRSVEAVKQFVRESVSPADRVAIMSASGRYMGSFSGNRQEILGQLNSATTKFNYNQPVGFDCPKLSPSEALEISRNHLDPVTMEAFIQNTISCARYDRLPPAEAKALAMRELRYQAIRQNEEYQFRTRSLLHSLRQYLRSFKQFEGRKLLILLSSGFTAGDVRYELQVVVK